MPCYAECGGLLYLADSLSWQGDYYDMAGVIPGAGVMHDRPIGRGYVQLTETNNALWPKPEPTYTGENISAHEFHYASLENMSGDHRYAYKVNRGHGIDGEHDGLILKNLMACFSHQRSLSTNKWAERFVNFVRSIKT